MSDIRLHWYWSTNPQKVRLALEELGLTYQRLKVELGRKEQKRPEYLEIHPRGQVPALEIDSAVLWESGAALAYLGQREGRLWPESAPQRAKALSLLFFETGAFQQLAGKHYRNLVIAPILGKDENLQELSEAREQIRPLLAVLEGQLEGDYLLGEITVVDLAFAPWLPHLDLKGFPKLVAWRERLRSRPSWKACGIRD